MLLNIISILRSVGQLFRFGSSHAEKVMNERNRKLHINMVAIATADQIRGQAQQTQQAQVIDPSGEKGQAAVQNAGEGLKKSMEDHEQTAVIGKGRMGRGRRPTKRSRSMRGQVMTRKGRALSLWLR